MLLVELLGWVPWLSRDLRLVLVLGASLAL
jgi:hypothetical protein